MFRNRKLVLEQELHNRKLVLLELRNRKLVLLELRSMVLELARSRMGRRCT